MIWVGAAAGMLAAGVVLAVLIGRGIHRADVEAGYALDELGQR